jgi:hypothetical protein
MFCFLEKNRGLQLLLFTADGGSTVFSCIPLTLEFSLGSGKPGEWRLGLLGSCSSLPESKVQFNFWTFF